MITLLTMLHWKISSSMEAPVCYVHAPAAVGQSSKAPCDIHGAVKQCHARVPATTQESILWHAQLLWLYAVFV